MTNIVITQEAVRNLATAFSKVDSAKLRHGERLALIAEAFGWKVDAFMHNLKENRGDNSVKKLGTGAISNFDASWWGLPRNLDDLGIRQVVAWKRVVDQPYGVVAVAGATGMGRTTTIVATAQFLAERGRKVFALSHDQRDVDVVLSSVNKGDVILFGEIRDFRSARLAYELADRGLLVLADLITFPEVSRCTLEGCLPPGKLELTRAVLSQFIIRKLARPAEGEGAGEGRYRGRVIISSLECFDDANTVADYFKRGSPWRLEILPDLASKLANSVTDMEEVNRVFGPHDTHLLNAMPVFKRASGGSLSG